MTRYLLDFTRSARADESAVALPRGDVEYQLRGRGQSRPELVELPWSDSLHEALEVMRDHTESGVGEAAARLGRILANFIKVPAWMLAAAQVAEHGGREFTALTIRSNAAELYLLPWELLSIDAVTHAGFLAKLLLRYEWPDTRTAARLPGLSPTKRGRVIFAWSAAGGKVDAVRHVKVIERAIDDAAGLFEEGPDRAFDEVKNASRPAIEAALVRARDAGEPVAVLHLLCHGAAQDDGTFALLLDDGAGGADAVSPSQLQQLLVGYAGLVRLVVISACDGGNAGAVGQALGSVAQEVHKAGFGAVIASRFPLSWEGARVFATALYDKLLRELTSLEDAFLAARAALAARASYDWASLQLYAREADGDATYVLNARPYRGLAAFAPEHARFFFGREREVDEVVRDLDALVARGLPRLLVVSGASGTGKSSMVLGGAIPRWRRTAGEKGFGHVVVRPGSSPAEALAQVDAREEEMASRGRFVVVVDQFEELFTHHDPAAATAFVRALWARACDPASGVCVLATLRIDFLARCSELVLDDAGLRFDKVACDPAHQVLVAQMSPEQLREAVEGPARSAGLALEPNLPDVIVRDVEAAPGALPLMSHALYLLWAARDGATLTRAAYAALGAVKGALDAHAEQVLAALPDDDDRAAARRLMVRLVHAGVGGEADTRWRRTLRELRPDDDAGRARLDRVLERLVDARLLVTGGAAGDARTVEIGHEALLKSWKTFRGWIDAERDRLVRLARLVEWVRDWKKNPDQLLAGSKLVYAEDVAAENGGDLDGDARELLTLSLAARERALREAERARRAKRAAVAGAFAALSTFLAVSVGLFLDARRQERRAAFNERKAVQEQWEATRARGVAEAGEVLSRAAVLRARGEVPGAELENLAAALALHDDAARRGLLRAEVTGALYQTTVAALYRRPLAGHGDELTVVEFSPDGSRVLTASLDHTARLWDARTGAPVATLTGHTEALSAAAFSPDGSRVVTASEDHTARLWDARAGGGLATLTGHTDAVSDARFSPDGSRVLTASADHTARLWDARTGAPVAGVLLAGHTEEVRRASYTADGTRIVTASADSTARVWDARTGRPLCACAGHREGLLDARFSPDARRLATASEDSTAALWDAVTCRRLASLHGNHVAPEYPEDDDVTRVAFSPDGSRLATASNDRTATLWGASRGERVAVLRGHTELVRDVVFAPDGATLYTASGDRTLRLWDATDGTPRTTWSGHTDDVVRLALNPAAGGARFVTASEDRTARLWSDRAGDLAVPLLAHTEPVVDARFSPDGARVVTASQDHTARLWSVATGALLATLDGHTDWLNAAAFSPDGSLLVTASKDHTVLLRDGRDGAVRHRLIEQTGGHTDSVSAVAFSADGGRIVTASRDHTACIWDTRTGARVALLRGHTGWVAAAAFSPDGARVVTASNDRTAGVWDARTGRRLAAFAHADRVTTAAFSPDGARVLTASNDRTARVWDARSGAALVTLTGHAGEVRCAWFSPDGSRVVTASNDATARVWDARSGATLWELRGHTAGINAAAWSADGSRVVTASIDGTARLWDARTGAALVTLQGHTGDVWRASFSPDGRRVVTASFDRTARLWDLDPAVTLRAARAILP